MHSMCNIKLMETVHFSEMTEHVITTWCQNPKGHQHFHNFHILVNLKMDHFRNGYKCFKKRPEGESGKVSEWNGHRLGGIMCEI